MAYESREDLAAKIAWEGGLEGFLDYGFDLEDVPEGDEELLGAADELLSRWNDYTDKANQFMGLLPEPEER